MGKTRSLLTQSIEPTTSQGASAEHAPSPADALTHSRITATRGHDASPQQAWLEPGDWLLGNRFCIARKLGAGGMGVVYAADDLHFGGQVALKVLPRADSRGIEMLKREFRGLRDTVHPNLVALFELFCDDQEFWFFSMELVDGVHFDEWIRTAGTDCTRLAQALEQLAGGLDLIHRGGRVHRDVKPSNILIERGGRLVILDFGLTHRIDLDHDLGPGAGTPGFVAPEVRAGQPPTPASDWYAAGVMLYETLTGHRPQPSMEATEIVRPPHEIDPRVPETASHLCLHLLDEDPQRRATAADVLNCAAMLSEQPGVATAVPDAPRNKTFAFVGRTDELALLHSSFHAVVEGKARDVFIHGPSGIGKSALVEEFLRQVTHAGAVVLRGRCYERESIPFKAFDGVIDSIISELGQMPQAERQDLLRHCSVLGQMFPALDNIPYAAECRPREAGRQRAARTDAFDALRDLLRGLLRRAPLVLWIDDLQWGDADSGKLLARVLSPAERPPLLFIGTYRSDERQQSPLFSVLDASDPSDPSDTRVDVTLGALQPHDSTQMVEMLLDGEGDVQTVVREAQGNPFFVRQMSLFIRQMRDRGGAPIPVNLATAIESRFSALTQEERRFLEILAVCSRPVDVALVSRAAALPSADQRALRLLENRQLVRMRITQRGHLVESYHDRVRETVLGGLDESARRQHHEAIVTALEETQTSDPEILADHYLGAGRREEALHHALRAADAAMNALAFDRAAEWLRLALELRLAEKAPGASVREVKLRLAEALASAGRGREAADCYLELAQDAQTEESLELSRLAAQQLLATGYEQEGFAVLDSVLSRVGARAAANMRLVIPRLLYQRLLLWLRGLKFERRRADELPKEQLLRIDATHNASISLIMGYALNGAMLGSLNLRQALDAGEPARVARALATELLYTTLGGDKGQRRTDKLTAVTAPLVAEMEDPKLDAYLQLARSLSAFIGCDFIDAAEHSQLAEQKLREECVGATLELNLVRLIWASPLILLGRFKQVRVLVDRWLEEAKDRQNRDLLTRLGAFPAYPLVAAGRGEEARDLTLRLLDEWPVSHADHGRYIALYSLVVAEAYLGQRPDRLQETARDIDTLRRTPMQTVPLTRILAACWAANADLAAASVLSGSARRRALRRAERRAARQRREDIEWAQALAHQVDAILARERDDDEAVIQSLERATQLFDSLGMLLFGAASRYRLGKIRGGDTGREEVQLAEHVMTEQGVAEPARFVRVYAPGYRDA